VAQHSLQNCELCQETSDSESVPKSGQVQLRPGAHARATFKFASETIGSINYPFAMLFHIELA
jgi:hypothetical protein